MATKKKGGGPLEPEGDSAKGGAARDEDDAKKAPVREEPAATSEPDDDEDEGDESEEDDEEGDDEHESDEGDDEDDDDDPEEDDEEDEPAPAKRASKASPKAAAKSARPPEPNKPAPAPAKPKAPKRPLTAKTFWPLLIPAVVLLAIGLVFFTPGGSGRIVFAQDVELVGTSMSREVVAGGQLALKLRFKPKHALDADDWVFVHVESLSGAPNPCRMVQDVLPPRRRRSGAPPRSSTP